MTGGLRRATASNKRSSSGGQDKHEWGAFEDSYLCQLTKLCFEAVRENGRGCNAGSCWRGWVGRWARGCGPQSPAKDRFTHSFSPRGKMSTFVPAKFFGRGANTPIYIVFRGGLSERTPRGGGTAHRIAGSLAPRRAAPAQPPGQAVTLWRAVAQAGWYQQRVAITKR